MLKDKKVAELREIADTYGVDREDAKTKAQLLARLEEEGITDELLGEVAEVAPAPAAAPVKSGPDVLVKMERANPTYEILGHRFTADHPYIAMSEDDAQKIFDHDPRGFRIATPNEVKEYYS